MNMCQDDAIVTSDHLLLHTNSLSAPVSDYPILILRVKTKLHRPMLLKLSRVATLYRGISP